jgi:1-deoxy-D-xylulose-5-phosphate reductoisomerase
MKRIALLGATGSIGRQAFEIADAHPDLDICAVAAGSTDLRALAEARGIEHHRTGGDLTALLEAAQPDVVLNAVVGFAGIGATLWALEHGIDLALANKESLVAAGDLALAAHARGGGRLLPVDSEHSATFQCLDGRAPESVDSLVLTASGGPFRGRTRDELGDVTPEQALAHPTWSMGPKITTDSATLANKGLEVIEAHFLFGLPYDRVEVVVHPSSTVHALVRFRDGSALAHLGYPDMRVPISYALTYPERAATPVPPLGLAGTTLSFEEPDGETFPLLPLAFAAGERGGTAPCAYNAANEIAVEAFLAGRLPFLGIADVVAETLARWDDEPARDLDDLLEADARARALAEQELVVA